LVYLCTARLQAIATSTTPEEVMKEEGKHNVLGKAASALANLSMHRDSRQHLVVGGAVRPLVGLLSQINNQGHGDCNSHTASVLTRAVVNLSLDPTYRLKACQHGATTILVSLVTSLVERGVLVDTTAATSPESLQAHADLLRAQLLRILEALSNLSLELGNVPEIMKAGTANQLGR
jgi:hypothetical protein